MTAETEERPGLVARVMARWRGQRARRPWLNHFVRAASHYASRQADLLSAAITYYAFLALFPVLLLAVAVAGFVLSGRPDLLAELIDQIRGVVPGDAGDQVIQAVTDATSARGAVGLVGLAGLLYAGISWISKMRIALQTIWRGHPDQPNFVKDKLRDLLSLIGLGGALVASVALTALATGLTSFVIDLLGLSGIPGIGVLTALLGVAIAIAGDTLIFLWLFVRLARANVPVRAVLPGALFGAVGFEILKLVGTFYITRVTSSPSAAVFGSVIGLLVWIYVSSRFLLFAAAWTSTLPRVVEQIIADAAAAEGADEPVLEGPRVPPLRRPVEGPSTSAVAVGLVGVGAVVGALTPPAVRRWWRRGRAAR